MTAPCYHIGQVDTGYGLADIYLGRYPSGAIAVELIAAGDQPEPFTIFSANLVAHASGLAGDEFFVKDWDIEALFVAPMLATGLFEDTGRRVSVDFARAPVWRLKNPAHIPPGHQLPSGATHGAEASR